ncbi:hypothetical protein [Sphingomonas sp. ERG5]|uniref:hypothetical protein n=1 Tax=Sphingomonas sp. ERG5 TaxID=1381597 RepID=UPI00068AB6A4|nr:hypothetical protein [Sphingomonas sp. ERG5]
MNRSIALSRLTLLASFTLLGGCVHDKMTEAQPSIAAMKAANGFEMIPLAVGPVVSSPADASFDRSIVIRGSTMSPPSGRFSLYLREVLITELRAAGRYDPTSPTIVSAVLTENRASEGFKQGTGVSAATFRVTRDGQTIFEEPIRAEVDWTSSFIGAIAIPAAFRTHSSLSNTLVAKLFADPGFRAAVAPK